MAAPTEVDRKKQRETRIAIGDLIEQNCKGCSTFAENHKRFGHYQAQGLCTAECDIGKQLFLLGQTLLTGRKPKPPVELNETSTKQRRVNQPLAEELIREKYIELSQSLPDYKIANQFDMSVQTLRRRKREWGLDDKRRNPARATRANGSSEKKQPSRPPQMPKLAERIGTAVLPPDGSGQQPQNSEIAKIAELEIKAIKQEEELLILKAENERLRVKCDEQVQQQFLEGRSIAFFQDFLGFMLTTRNEEAAEEAKRTLLQIGVDFDYRVRSGVIEVTTEIRGSGVGER
ncbi:zinc-finger domain-containing protein [Brevibacillus agri]|uniref:zinc-finger domain-containing protein n=1 Tax=Brevibacillus agri TaxID=51101 RepID=UPI003D229EC5